MSEIRFEQAKRENIPLLIACEGASGSGKTKSALYIGQGICAAIDKLRPERKAKMAVVDTENRRALHYADDFDFLHLDMQPPFSPLRFGEALDAVERAGIDVAIFDTFSHEWSGEGGVKEWADMLERGVPKDGIENPRQPGDSWDWWKDWKFKPTKPPGNWDEPKSTNKPGHKWLVNRMLRSSAHIILTLRSEEKMLVDQVAELNTDGTPKMWNGKAKMKTVIVAPVDRPLLERWVPDCEKKLPYEISTSILFVPTAPGVPIIRKGIQAKNAPAIDTDRPVTPHLGYYLGMWAGGARVKADPEPQPQVEQQRPAEPQQKGPTNDGQQPRADDGYTGI